MTADAGPHQHAQVEELRDPAKLGEWIKLFPWLDDGEGRLP
ncbi:hypothetical protein ACWEOI_12760 [Nocardia sp. NPDC004340]